GISPGATEDLEELLEEAAMAERGRAPADPEGFLQRLRSRRGSPAPLLTPRRTLTLSGWGLAAVVPLLLALVITCTPEGQPAPPAERPEADLAVIQDLDLLEDLLDLLPESVESFDAEEVEILLEWDLLEGLPLEVLENS
ncbi:MAG: hypothetical protein ACE5GW_11730, partial [Planctomycetota bacterium]